MQTAGLSALFFQAAGFDSRLTRVKAVVRRTSSEDWVLFVVLASASGSEKAINSTAVPMATEQLCNAAKEKLTQAYRNTQTPNYVLVTE